MNTRKPWIFVVVGAVVTLISGLSVVYSTYQTRILISDFLHLQNQHNELQTEWGQLLLEQSTWGSLSRVERLAGKKLEMHVPDPQQIVMVAQ